MGSMVRVTVEPVVFLYSVGYIVQYTILQDFVFFRLCNDHYSQKICDNDWKPDVAQTLAWVQADTVRRVMIMSIIASVLAIMASQFLGAALDKYSRKVVMLVPFMGSLALNLLCVIVAAVPTMSLNVLYLGSALNGCAGGFVAFKASVSSYVVSISNTDNRTNKLAVVESMLFLGSAAGPIALQLADLYVTQRHSFLFLGTETIIFGAILYIIFILPDTEVIPQFKKEVSCSKKRLPNATYQIDKPMTLFGYLCNAITTTFRKRSSGLQGAVIALFIADFFIGIVYSAEFDLQYLYMQDKMEFTLPQYSQFLGFKNLVNGVSLLVLLPLLRRAFRLSDYMLGIFGGLSRLIAFTFMALIKTHGLVYIAPFLDIFGQYLFVVLRSIISSIVDSNEQGRALTVMASMAQFSLLSGSIVFDSVYPVFLADHQPGLTFILAAASMAIASIILGCVYWHWKIRIKATSQEERRPLLD